MFILRDEAFLHPPFNNICLRDIGLGTKHKKICFLEWAVATVSYFVHYDILLQNVTYIVAKSDSCFNTKCDKDLSQNASRFLMWNNYYKMQQFASVQCIRHFQYNFKNWEEKACSVNKINTTELLIQENSQYNRTTNTTEQSI